MKFDSFMAAYSDAELKVFIENYETLEKDGAIGDCPLRTAAEDWEKTTLDKSTSVVLWMHTIAHYAYKKFAHKYLAGVE